MLDCQRANRPERRRTSMRIAPRRLVAGSILAGLMMLTAAPALAQHNSSTCDECQRSESKPIPPNAAVKARNSVIVTGLGLAGSVIADASAGTIKFFFEAFGGKVHGYEYGDALRQWKKASGDMWQDTAKTLQAPCKECNPPKKTETASAPAKSDEPTVDTAEADASKQPADTRTPKVEKAEGEPAAPASRKVRKAGVDLNGLPAPRFGRSVPVPIAWQVTPGVRDIAMEEGLAMGPVPVPRFHPHHLQRIAYHPQTETRAESKERRYTARHEGASRKARTERRATGKRLHRRHVEQRRLRGAGKLHRQRLARGARFARPRMGRRMHRLQKRGMGRLHRRGMGRMRMGRMGF